MSEDSAVKIILAAQPSLDHQMAFDHLQAWFAEDQQNQVSPSLGCNFNENCSLQISGWTQDKIVVQWLEQFNQSSSIHDRIMTLHKESARENILR